MKQSLRRFSPFARLEDQNERILSNQTKILSNQNMLLERTKNIMASQADLDTAIAQEGTDLTTLQATVQSLITKLGTNPDFTAEVTQLQAFDAAINTLNANAAAATSGTSAPTGGSTPAPTSGSSAPAAS